MRERLPIASGRDALRYVRAEVAGRRGLAAATALALVGAAVASLLVPPLLGRIVDLILEDRSTAALTGTTAVLAGAIVVQALLTGAGNRLVAQLGETGLARLRERVVARALGISVLRLERAGSGDLLSRVGSDVAVVGEAVREIVPEMARAGLVVGLTAIGLAALDWRLALVAILAMPVQLTGLRVYLRRVVPLYARQRVQEGERAHELVAAIGGARTARQLGLGAQRRARVLAASERAAGTAVDAAHAQARTLLLALNAGELVGLAAVLICGFALVDNGSISVGDAAAAGLYFHRAFDPVGALLFLVDDVQAAGSALTRLVGVLALEPEAAPSTPPPARDEPIRARGVGFAYTPGAPVLHGVDLDVAAGERVALIGTTGAGKSTFARLVAGIDAPATGTLTPADRRGAMLVTQDVHVFAGTIADDLRLAAPDASDDEIAAALALTGARWVDALPDGIETVVGEGGHDLTGTQAQQLALARLALRDPAIAVLDEATAEAGSAGARELEAGADRVLEGRTALVVAHRLTQAARADRVVVLEGGRVVEQGAPDELRAAGGRYAELWASWSAER